LHYKGD